MARSIAVTLGAGGGLSLSRTVTDAAGSADSVSTSSGANINGLQLANNPSAYTGPAAGGYTNLTTQSGNLTVTTANAVIQGLDITGTLLINANNVTVRGCLVRGGIRHDSDLRASQILYTEVGPPGLAGVVDPGTGMAVNPGYALMDYCNIHNGPDLTWPQVGTSYTPVIRRTWFHDAEDPSDVDPHADAMQISGGTGGFTIEDCYVDHRKMWMNGTGAVFPTGQRRSKIPNSAIQVGENPTNGTVTCRRNMFAGGAFTTQFNDASNTSNWFYVVEGNWYGRGTVSVTENGSPQDQTFPIFGAYKAGNSLASHFTWSGNKYADLSGNTWVEAGAVSGP